MEIASSLGYRFRMATRGDSGRITAFLRKAKYDHRHADWSYPADWLGGSGFWMCEQENGDSPGEIVAILAAAADPPPAAWVRIAACSENNQLNAIFAELMRNVAAQLSHENITQVGWLPATSWPTLDLAAMGFECANWIITYVKFGVTETKSDLSSVEIRQATLDDIEEMASIEEAAFDPIWRHSALGLRSAFGQAVCFEVAHFDGRIAGFQYSVRGYENDMAHLVRITVHPEAQRRGIGSSLMASAIESFIRMGVSNVSLNTQLDNLASHRLYEKFGFRRIGERIPMWVMDLSQGEN